MPKCPGCQYPIDPSQILCSRCIYEDERIRWPQCQHCFQWNADCGESGYRLCYPCYQNHLLWLNNVTELLQTSIRGFLARRLLKKHRAAKSIQAVWRGHLTRLQLVALH